MALMKVIAQIDAEISKLQQARALLSDGETATAKVGRGRPKGSKNAATKSSAASVPASTPASKPKRRLSPEGRKAIAEAMKRRWAERRKQG